MVMQLTVTDAYFVRISSSLHSTTKIHVGPKKQLCLWTRHQPKSPHKNTWRQKAAVPTGSYWSLWQKRQQSFSLSKGHWTCGLHYSKRLVYDSRSIDFDWHCFFLQSNCNDMLLLVIQLQWHVSSCNPTAISAIACFCLQWLAYCNQTAMTCFIFCLQSNCNDVLLLAIQWT